MDKKEEKNVNVYFTTVAKMRFRPRIAEIQEMAICPSVGEKKR